MTSYLLEQINKLKYCTFGKFTNSNKQNSRTVTKGFTPHFSDFSPGEDYRIPADTSLLCASLYSSWLHWFIPTLQLALLPILLTLHRNKAILNDKKLMNEVLFCVYKNVYLFS